MTLLNANLLIKNENENFHTIPTQIYEDTNASLSIKTIQQIDNFKPYTNNISKGYSESAFWIKFDVTNQTKKTIKYFIHFTEPYQDTIDCYIVSKNSTYIREKDGVGYFINNKKNHLTKPTFALNMNAMESKTIYLRITSIYPLLTSFHIMNKDSLNNFSHKYDIMHAFFFGAIIILLLYNLVIFFYTRDLSYIYYVLFGLSFALWQLIISASYPLNYFSSTASFYSFSAAIPSFIGFFVLFARSILDVKELFPRVDIIFKVAIFVQFLLTIGAIFSMKEFISITNVTGLILLPLVFFISFKSYFAGNKTAIFFIIAQLAFMSFSFIFALATEGYLEYSFLHRYGILLGSLIEMVLFSLALSYKIKLLEEEKLSLISKANIELNENVKKRTKELEESKNRLQELANKDPLTNLQNRRSLFDSAEILLALAKRKKESLSLLLFDIDNFKSINDTYGHNIGDSVIVEFAKLLQKSRKSDIAVRYGGEEFILLLPDTAKDDAFNMALSLKNRVHDIVIETPNKQQVSFTVSCGLSTYDFENDNSLDDAIIRADKALYICKNGGKDMVAYL